MPLEFKANAAGIRELLREGALLADLEARAARVAAAASDSEAEYGYEAEMGRTRARAAVFTANFAAMHAEAKEHRLARAIDAAR
jgi:hypothetical protein